MCLREGEKKARPRLNTPVLLFFFCISYYSVKQRIGLTLLPFRWPDHSQTKWINICIIASSGKTYNFSIEEMDFEEWWK
jgi:hypothetical protein